MENPVKKEDYLIQIRDKLRKDGIKLWLPPFYLEPQGSSASEVQNLAKEFSNSLEIPVERCQEIIAELQENSLENLKQKNRFQESGLATIKIKITSQGSPPRIIVKELLLSMRGCDLKSSISKEINLPEDRIKLISSGKVLNDVDNLSGQGVKNGHQILAIILCASPTDIMQNEKKRKDLENVKYDSKLLALDNEYMQLEDQFGNPVKIPEKEKKKLIVAMALHEKGRTALKKEDYSRALIFLLEADEEFRHCNSQLLNTVDNYALLDLDIAWCYLCLQSFTHLPEAEVRLKRCEERFHKTYGVNLERLIAVKGTHGNEAGLFMRLHLLQAVVLYHQNKRTEALALFKRAEGELSTLKVDDNSVTALIELGFSLVEARVGLRATAGDVNMAANYINENRQKRMESRKKAKAAEILEKERKKLGKCVDGVQYVDPNFLKLLVNMGYGKEIARIALQKSNNIISDSIQYIQENPTPGPSHSKSQEFMALIDDMVPQLVEAGFDTRMAKIALQKHNGEIMKAAEELLANNGMVSGDLTEYNIRQESVDELLKKKHHKSKDEQKEKAFKRLAEDISLEEDDHLDLNLLQEEVFLQQYLSLLEEK